MSQTPRDERPELLDLGQRVVALARAAGVDVAEAVVRSAWDLSAKVRLGEPELVEEAGSRGVSLKVSRDQRVAATSTSDLSEAGLALLVRNALELTNLTAADPFDGPADPSDLLSKEPVELDLYDPAVAALTAGEAIERALRAERAALEADARLTLSEGATFGRRFGATALVLSSGFARAERGTYASLVVSPVALDAGDKRRRGFYWTARRHLAELESEEDVGREAARRTVAQLGARRIPTGQLPVVFSPDAARSLLGAFCSCLLGGSIWRRSSYLVGREGTAVASPLVTLVDDALIPRGPGSRPYDGEGLPSRTTTVVEAGVLKTYLLDTYSARKLGLSSTASASRAGASPAPSTTNFFMRPGALTEQELLASTERALYVTQMMGFGFNAVTGDFSRGAAGFLLERGESVHPVSEITISSNLDTMLKTIDAVADDLDLSSSTASPTFRVASMMISGE